jgi:LuxR family maltose regulon positive regulatory protein
VIEILILQSAVHSAQGDRPGALACVQRAVSLAEPEGYVRVFIDAGPRLASLLTSAAKVGATRRFVRRLQAASTRTEVHSDLAQDLIEPLSKRELEVLRLLGTHLGGPDIARELVVSLNTMRTHTKHIYAKLGVNSRRAAVHQGKQLNLL